MYLLLLHWKSISASETDLLSSESHHRVSIPQRLLSPRSSHNRITNSVDFQEPVCPSEVVQTNGLRLGGISRAIQSHTPIRITSNSDFLSQAATEGWPGTGTSSNPILIENINIISADTYTFIDIQDTSLFFQILNCNLDRGTSSLGHIGISFDDVRNGLIVRNNISNFVESGISISYSPYCNISGNTIIDSPRGIDVDITESAYIQNNIISNNLDHSLEPVYGISLFHSFNNTLIGNYLYNAGLYIAASEDSHYIQYSVTNNYVNDKHLLYLYNVTAYTATGGGAGQIFVINSANIEISGHELTNTSNAIFVYQSSNLSIHNNMISGIDRIGIQVMHANNISIFSNVILECIDGAGISVDSSFNVSIIENNVSFINHWGIRTDHSHYLNISGNTASYNHWEGIYVCYSENSSFIGNLVFNNDDTGMMLMAIALSVISSNFVSNNGFNGIELRSSYNYDSTDNFIFNNHVTNNTNYGMYVAAYYSNIRKNEIDNNRAGGLYPGGSNCSILNNYIHDNSFWGISITRGNISSNIIKDNGDYGIYLRGGLSYVFNNTIKNQNWGIYLHRGRSNYILNNTLENTGIGLTTPSSELDLDDYYHKNVTGNTINGKKLIFWCNVSDKTIPQNTGQIILLDCRNIMISHQTLYNSSIGLICLGTRDLIICENNVSYSLFEGMYFWYTSNVTLKDNYVIKNDGDGIYFLKVEDLRIFNNTITENNDDGVDIQEGVNLYLTDNSIVDNRWHGIFVRESFQIDVTENILCNNRVGVQVRESDLVLIFNNKLYSNYYSGAKTYRSNDIIIAFNEAFNNTEAGIHIRYGNNFTISCNIAYANFLAGILVNDIDNHFFGYKNTVDSNLLISNNNSGILVWDSPGVTIINNTLQFNENFGLSVDDSDLALIHNNTFSQNSIGLHFIASKYCNVTLNTFFGNSMYAIESRAWRTMVSFNNFIDNNQGGGSQLYDGQQLGGNTYSFNYYSDWIGPDIDGDGIVDSPYLLEGPEGYLDYYPLITAYDPSVHLVSRPRVIYPNGNEVLAYGVHIEWSPSVDSFGDSVTYTIFYSPNAGNSWILLADRLTGTLFYWDLSSVPDGSNYLVKVVAISSSAISSEDISDSTFIIQNSEPTTTESSSTIKPLSTPSWTLFLLLVSMLVFTLFRVFKRRSGLF